MNTGVISMRYAKALLAYASEQGAEDAIYRNMLQLIASLQQVKEFAEVLNAPSLTKEERVRLLCSAVDSSTVYALGSTLHGISQARILVIEMGCHFFLQGIFSTQA